MKDLKQLIAGQKDRWQRGFGDSESVKSLLLALRERVEEKKNWYSGGGNKPIRDVLDEVSTLITEAIKSLEE